MKDEDLSNVPASVIKQQKEAERKIKEVSEPDEAAHEVNTAAPAIDKIPIEVPATPAIVDTNAAPVEPAINDGMLPDDQFEQKYKVLQGKYNKEIGDLQTLVVDLKAQMERQETVIQGLNSQHSEQAPAKVDVTDLNPEDFQGWGPEMKTMVDTVNKLKTVIDGQNQTIADLKGQPAAARTTEQDDGLQGRVETLESEINDGRITSYLKYLDDNIKGNWRAMNKDASFNAWLAQVDAVSMATRKTALTSAADNLRGSQVASIFNLYITENGAGAGVIIADELPDIGAGGGADLTPKVTLTQEDVTKAQTDFVKGRITEAEFDVIFAKYQSTLRGQKR